MITISRTSLNLNDPTAVTVPVVRQVFLLVFQEKTLVHRSSGLCLSLSETDDRRPVMEICNGSPLQIWELK